MLGVRNAYTVQTFQAPLHFARDNRNHEKRFTSSKDASEQPKRMPVKPPGKKSLLSQLKRHPIRSVIGALMLVGGILRGSQSYQGNKGFTLPDMNLDFNSPINPNRKYFDRWNHTSGESPGFQIMTLAPVAPLRNAGEPVLPRLTRFLSGTVLPPGLPKKKAYSFRLYEAWTHTLQNYIARYYGQRGADALNFRLPISRLGNELRHTDSEALQKANKAGHNQGVTLLDRILSSQFLIPEHKRSLVKRLQWLGAKTSAELPS